MRGWVGILCAALIEAGAIPVGGADDVAELARAGKSRWQVYLPKSAGPVERFARDEFREYTARMSGAQLKDASRADAAFTVQLGLRHDLGRVNDLPEPKPGHDGYSLLVTPKRIAIAGENPRGVLYGVYDLLERLGCRWYQPALDPADPEVVPRNPDLSLPGGQWSEAGRIELRIFNGSAFFFELHPDRMRAQLDWAAKNRYNGVSWQAHHRPGAVGE